MTLILFNDLHILFHDHHISLYDLCYSAGTLHRGTTNLSPVQGSDPGMEEEEEEEEEEEQAQGAQDGVEEVTEGVDTHDTGKLIIYYMLYCILNIDKYRYTAY